MIENYVPQTLLPRLERLATPGKVVVYGPRRVGKTTLMMVERLKRNFLPSRASGELPSVHRR